MNRISNRFVQASLYVLIVSFTACQNSEVQQPGELNNADEENAARPENEVHKPPESISMDKQIEDAVIDLSTRTGFAVDAITVKEARAVQWGSGAMGCPKPGMNYTQALVPGIRLLLEVDGTIYYYHGATGRSLFNCPAERAQAPAYGKGLEVM